MPEGPEVRKYADALDKTLAGRTIKTFSARTRVARKWLEERGDQLHGRLVTRVVSHGKHLIGHIQGGFYFHSHLMMWGRWQTFKPRPPKEIDRRERARIVVDRGAAILFSAPIFNVGQGDPYEQVEYLDSLGPDVIPYKGRFKAAEFRRRLALQESTAIGAALLNQQVVAGIGNYLRAEILFDCRIDPWKLVDELSKGELKCLSKSIPEIASRSYKTSATALEVDRRRMSSDASLVYQPGREYGTRHLVFRRTNLPCLECGSAIRQLRQATTEERDRIMYFCPKCQGVAVHR
jgi:endonuclease VIII